MLIESRQERSAVLRIFVFLIAWLVVGGWGLSCLRALDWMPWLAGLGLVVAGWLWKRWSGSIHNLRLALAEPLAAWPFLLITGIILAGAVTYSLPVMLDSLTYRLPQIHLWITDGYIHPLASAEDRLNYMPQSWGLATLPLVQLAGDRLVWFWNLISWVALYLLAYDWAFEFSGDQKKSRAMAFIGSASTLAVLQAASSANDLFAAVMALLALRFVMDFERARDWRDIVWAVFSFCLAAGTKPHFSVFGLPLVLWFLFSPAQPWRAFRWVWAPACVVVWLLCSPVPSFVLNVQTYGTWAGPGQSYSMKGQGAGWNMLLGTTMLLWQAPQPPVNPMALVYGQKINQAVNDSGLKKLVPRFNLGQQVVSMVDTASLGLVTFALLIAGIILARLHNPRSWCSWAGLALAAGLLSTELGLSHFVSGSSGRAYCGFLYFALPLALAGWSYLRPGWLRLALYATLGSSLLVLILNPSRPLWPAQWVKNTLSDSPRYHWLAEKMEPYYIYAQRANTADEIVLAIPTNEPGIVALVGEDRPLLPLFRPYDAKRKVLFLSPHASPNDLDQLGGRYVVVGGGAELFFPELCEYLATSTNYSLVISRTYTSKLALGEETWRLYQKNSSTCDRAH